MAKLLVIFLAMLASAYAQNSDKVILVLYSQDAGKNWQPESIKSNVTRYVQKVFSDDLVDDSVISELNNAQQKRQYWQLVQGKLGDHPKTEVYIRYNLTFSLQSPTPLKEIKLGAAGKQYTGNIVDANVVPRVSGNNLDPVWAYTVKWQNVRLPVNTKLSAKLITNDNVMKKVPIHMEAKNFQFEIQQVEDEALKQKTDHFLAYQCRLKNFHQLAKDQSYAPKIVIDESVILINYDDIVFQVRGVSLPNIRYPYAAQCWVMYPPKSIGGNWERIPVQKLGKWYVYSQNFLPQGNTYNIAIQSKNKKMLYIRVPIGVPQSEWARYAQNAEKNHWRVPWKNHNDF